MKKLNKKSILLITAAVSGTLIVVIALGVVFGTKESKSENTLTPNETKSVSYETALKDILPEKKVGYKDPILIIEKTTYKPNSNVGTNNAFVVYRFDVDGSDNTLKQLEWVIKVNITKAAIIEADVSLNLLTSTNEIEVGTDIAKLDKPQKINKYKDWSAPSFTNVNNEVIQLSDIANLKGNEEFKAIYTSEPDDNHTTTIENLKSIKFVKTFKFLKPNAIGSIGGTSKDFIYDSEFGLETNLPKTVGYSPWSLLVITKNDTNKTEIADVKTVNADESFLVTYSADLITQNYQGTNKIYYTITYNVKKAKSEILQSTTASANYAHESDALPNSNAPTTKAKGYLDWSIKPVYKVGTKEVTTLVELDELEIDATFSATYTALKNPNYDTLSDVTHTITYKVIKGTPENITNHTKKASFNKNATQFGEFATRTKGWLPFTYVAKAINGDVYNSIDQVNALPLQTVFSEIYTAKPDPKYTTTQDLIITIEYTVFNFAPTFNNAANSFTEEYKKSAPSLNLHDPINNAPGYDAWFGPTYRYLGKTSTNAGEIINLVPVGEQFIITYEAARNKDYSPVDTNARITVVYTVVA